MSDTEASPLMRQYREIKRGYPGAILLFRVGDFYEMFYEDAQIASKLLSIALTCIASYLMLVAAERISRFLGVTGLSVMNRVIGLIIGAIAVQFMFDGLSDTFPGLRG